MEISWNFDRVNLSKKEMYRKALVMRFYGYYMQSTYNRSIIKYILNIFSTCSCKLANLELWKNYRLLME